MNNLKNKIIIITGAGDGLGKQIALDAASDGAKVVLVSKTEEKLKKLKNGIESVGGIADYYVCDISNLNEVDEVSRKILDKYKNIDVLVNNAGIYFEGTTTDTTNDQVKKMIEVNTLGTIYCTKAFLPNMKDRNEGQILNVVSVAGVEANEEYTLYTASKFAITGFTEALRKELIKTKIKVSAIYPEGIKTNIFAVSGGCDYSKEEPEILMDPKNVSEIVMFILKQPVDINLSRVDIKKKI